MRSLNLRDKAWLTINECRKLLGWSRVKIWKAVKDGHFDAVRDGGSDENPRYKIGAQSIENYIKTEAERLRRIANGEDAA